MITLVPIGDVESNILENLKQPLAEAFGQNAEVRDGMELTGSSRDQRRGQYVASLLLVELPPPRPGDIVLGVVDVDIFAPGLNFVFGEAEIGGRKAIISLARLRQEFYGLSRNERLFRERAVKEAVHELGHTCGLKHCPHPTCVMHFSNSLRDTDIKGWRFCPDCQARLKP
jgi:archaemetzincin